MKLVAAAGGPGQGENKETEPHDQRRTMPTVHFVNGSVLICRRYRPGACSSTLFYIREPARGLARGCVHVEPLVARCVSEATVVREDGVRGDVLRAREMNRIERTDVARGEPRGGAKQLG